MIHLFKNNNKICRFIKQNNFFGDFILGSRCGNEITFESQKYFADLGDVYNLLTSMISWYRTPQKNRFWEAIALQYDGVIRLP